MKPVIRPATATDLERFYGYPPRRTQRAVVGRVNGRVIGIGGVAYIDGLVWAFCDLKPTAKKYPVALVKACRTILDTAKKAGATTIWTQVDPKQPTAPAFVSRLGFVPTAVEGIYRWQR